MKTINNSVISDSLISYQIIRKLSQKLLVLSGLVLFSLGSYAQLDTIHYIPASYTNSSQDDRGTLKLVLSTNEATPFQVYIENGDQTYSQSYALSAAAPVQIALGSPNIADGTDPQTIAGQNITGGAIGVVGINDLNKAIGSEGLILHGSKPFFVNVRYYCGAQGNILASKGSAALGTHFYSGHMYSLTGTYDAYDNQFISVMATENNTYVTFRNPRIKWDKVNNQFTTIKLKRGDTYTIGLTNSELIQQLYNPSGTTTAGRSMNETNGTYITSNKPIAVNCGSWCASGTGGAARDMGYDEIAPVEVVGNEYIIVKGRGQSSNATGDNERVIVVATEAGTHLTFYSNNVALPITTTLVNDGDYTITDVSYYYSGTTDMKNFYFIADKPVYVYQTLNGDLTKAQTAGFCFIPPLRCTADPEVTIPFVDNLSGLSVNPALNVITKATSIIVNGTTYNSYKTVKGKANWYTYSLEGLTDGNANTNDHWNVKSPANEAINASLAAMNNNVGAAGFFSGFGEIPNASANPQIGGTGICVSNAHLSVTNAHADWSYQWYKNGVEISGATSPDYDATSPGRYKVIAIVTCDGAPSKTFPSNVINVLTCLDFSSATASVVENQGSLTLTVSLSNVSTDDVTFDIALTDITAKKNVDYQPPAILNNITIPAGQTSKTISVPIINDNINEPDETFQVTLVKATNASIKNGSIICTIVDDGDPPPAMNVSFVNAADASGISEAVPGGKTDLSIKLARESGYTVTANYQFVDNTATYSQDYSYSASTGTITFLPGETEKIVSITIVNDNIYEPEALGYEGFSYSLSGLQHAVAGTPVSLNVHIVDDDAKPAMSLNAGASTTGANEGSNLVYTFDLSRPCDVPVTFLYRTTDVTATNGSDYSGSPSWSLVTIPAGNTSATITIPTNTDAITEPNETFNLELQPLLNVTIGTTFYICSIYDASAKPQITINDASSDEGAMNSFLVTLSHPLSYSIILDVVSASGTATQGVDFTAPAAQLTIPANSTTATISVNHLEDTFEEGNENYTVTITYAGADVDVFRGTATGTIIDNDHTPLARNDNFSMNEDQSLSNTVAANDDPGDPPSVFTLNGSTSHGSLSFNSNGSFTYTPNPDFNGTDQFTYHITDSDNDVTAPALVTITILQVDDIPLAANDAFTMKERTSPLYTPLSGSVLTNDTGLGDGVTVQLVSNVTHGTLVLNTDGTFTYQPTAQFFSSSDANLASPILPDRFTYKLIDNLNSAQTSNATASINVQFYNDAAPVTVNDNASTNDVTPVTIDVLANDNDIDGNFTIDHGSLIITQQPARGSAIVSGGKIVYTPTAGPDGTVTIKYKVSDFVIDGVSSFESNIATVTVTINSTNQPPVANCKGNYILALNAAGTGIISTSDLDNGSYDPDGTFTLSISDVNHVLTTQPDGKIYVDCSAKGGHIIRLTATDNFGAQAWCDVTITVADTTKPIITSCKSDTTVYFSEVDGGAIVSYAAPLFSDNCDGNNLSGTLIMGFSSGSFFATGNQLVKYEYSDNSGNGPVNCAFTITLTPLPSLVLNSSDPDNSICENDVVTFTATPTHAVLPVTYKFYLNGTNIQSGASATFISGTLLNGDKVKVSLTDGNGNTAQSSELVITVLPGADTGIMYQKPNN